MPGRDDSPALLARRLIFGNPERSVVRISRDGTRIAFLAPVDGVLNLWVAPLEAIEEARPVTAVTDRNLGPAIIWVHDNRHIVSFREQGGDENWRIWRVDLHSGDVIPLTPGSGVKSFVQQASRHFPDELLIGHNERDKRYFDLYRVNVATGETTLMQVNDGFAGFFTDRQFRVRHARRMAENGDVEHLKLSDDGDWQPVARIASED